eukprot:8932044-Karenia_brevis.AAC.1
MLLRQCASWCKLVYSARTVPPDLHMDALDLFKGHLRSALEHLAGGKLGERNWGLAQLSIANCGLGIRDPVRHASAAYLASLAHTQQLCLKIDVGFD